MTQAPELEVGYVPIESLFPHPANPRRGNVAAIAESIKTNGWHGVIVVQKSTQRILVGKHRWEAAKTLGMTHVPAQVRDVDDVEAMRIIIADNRASDLASYDDDQLLRNLKDIGNGQGTLFTIDDIETLEAKVGTAAVIVEHEFKGDYADAGEEMEQRAAAAERAGQEMKDVVLAMRPSDYATFLADVKVLQKRWGVNGVIATVLMAVHRAAADESIAAVTEEKVNQMRAMLRKLEWAVKVGTKEHTEYLEAVV